MQRTTVSTQQPRLVKAEDRWMDDNGNMHRTNVKGECVSYAHKVWQFGKTTLHQHQVRFGYSSSMFKGLSPKDKAFLMYSDEYMVQRKARFDDSLSIATVRGIGDDWRVYMGGGKVRKFDSEVDAIAFIFTDLV